LAAKSLKQQAAEKKNKFEKTVANGQKPDNEIKTVIHFLNCEKSNL